MFPPEAFQSTVHKVAHILRRLGIRFHLAGGVTSILYGEPRMTQDIDLVVDPRGIRPQLAVFLDNLRESDFLYDADSLRAAVMQGTMFQLFDKVEALKLDLYPRELIEGELDRSCTAEIFAGVELPVVSRTDAAAAKLIWISKGSHKSRRDFRQIYRTSSAEERQRIADFAQQAHLQSLLQVVLEESEELS